MMEIVEMLKALKEDKPYLRIDEDLIKSYVEEYIDIIVKEIKDEF